MEARSLVAPCWKTIPRRGLIPAHALMICWVELQQEMQLAGLMLSPAMSFFIQGVGKGGWMRSLPSCVTWMQSYGQVQQDVHSPAAVAACRAGVRSLIASQSAITKPRSYGKSMQWLSRSAFALS